MSYVVPADDRMMDVTLTAGQTVIDTDFPVLANADLTLIRVRAGVETVFVLDTDYGLADVGVLGYKRITLAVAAEASDRLVIRGTRTAARTSNLLSGEMRASVFNEEFRALVIGLQELARDRDRALSLAASDETSGSMELPDLADRKGKFLKFNSTTGLPEPAASTTSPPQFHVITDTPGAGLGADGDIAIWMDAGDAEHGNFYEKVSGAWQLKGSLLGPTGPAGADGGGVPNGGAAGEALVKLSATDQDTGWGSVAGAPSQPQCRLGLVTGTPIIDADATGLTAVRAIPFGGKHMPLWNGSKFVMTDMTGELVNDLTDATKNPTAAGAGNCIDLFGWNDGGTMRLGRGPSWSSDTARGTGAGTTELEWLHGLPVNKYDITNGPTARSGVYIGSIRTNASAQIDFKFGSLASGGGEAIMSVWNLWNQRRMAGSVRDSTANWSYNSATLRAWNASNTNRVSALRGLTAPIKLNVNSQAYTGAAGQNAQTGVDEDGASTIDSTRLFYFSSASAAQVPGATTWERQAFGWHYYQGVEKAGGAYSVSFYGNGDGSLDWSMEA
jgi:hypothetical protein